MAYSKVRWIFTPTFLACVGGAHGRGEGANVCKGARTAEVWARMAEEGGRACTVQRRACMAGGAHGSKEWRQGGGFASSSFLLASSLHDWLIFGFSIQEIS
jgi:hypothetical protein